MIDFDKMFSSTYVKMGIDSTKPIKFDMGIIFDGTPKWFDIVKKGVEIIPGIDKRFKITEHGMFVINIETGESERICLYIRDQAIRKIKAARPEEYVSNYKFHITWCSTLEDMQKKNRFQKYLGTNNTSGQFFVKLIYEDLEYEFDGKHLPKQKLYVCKNCLKELNYHNYNSLGISEQKKIVENFDIKKFFEEYSKFSFNPNVPDCETAPINNYAKKWEEISEEYRKSQKWICERCGADCSKNHSFLHVHHKNGIKSDNSLSNLEALCKSCHRKEHRNDYHS